VGNFSTQEIRTSV